MAARENGPSKLQPEQEPAAKKAAAKRPAAKKAAVKKPAEKRPAEKKAKANVPAADESSVGERRAPRPAASAASRARRIGGAVHAQPPTPGSTDDDEAKPVAPSEADRSSKASSKPSSKPAAEAAAKDKAKDKAKDAETDDAPTAEPARIPLLTKLKKAAVRQSGDRDTIDSDDESDADEKPSAPRDVPGWLTWAPAAVLVAGVIAMAVVVSIVSHGVWWGNDASSQRSVIALRQQVVAAAKTCLATTNTYKYTAIDAFEKAGLACTTGKQTTDFRKAVDTLIRKNAATLKFTQTAQINKAAIESVSGNQWTILLYGQLLVTNVQQPTGRTDPFSATVRMEKVKGKWLIASLRPVSSPIK